LHAATLLLPPTLAAIAAGVQRLCLHRPHQQQQWQHTLHYSTNIRASPHPTSTADSDDEDTLEDATNAASSSSSSGDPAAAKLQPEKPLRVERLLANLGYGKRQECALMLKRRRVVYADSGKPAKVCS
jgi:hypothetical protein